MKLAVDRILNNFNESREKFGLGTPRQDVKQDTNVKQTFSKPKYLVSISLLIIIIIGLSCGLPFMFIHRNKDPNNEITSTSPPTTTSTNPALTSSSHPLTSTSTQSSTTDFTTPSTVTTTEEPLNELKIIKRQAWVSQGLDINGKYKQLTPVERIIVIYTQNESCFNEVGVAKNRSVSIYF